MCVLDYYLFLLFSRIDESTSRSNTTDDSQSYQYLTLEIVSSQLRAAVSVDGATVLLVCYSSSILSLSLSVNTDIFCLVISPSR